MTTNQERAAEIIAPWIEKEWGHPEDNAESAAEALAEAGLLAPDFDRVTRVTVVGCDGIVFEDYAVFDSGCTLTIQDDGRTLKLLAAAEYTKEHPNE